MKTNKVLPKIKAQNSVLDPPEASFEEANEVHAPIYAEYEISKSKLSENGTQNNPTMDELKQNLEQKFPTPEKGCKDKKGFDLKELLTKMWDENHLDNASIDDDPKLSKSENRIRKDIIMNEMKERARAENPDVYHFVYGREDTRPEIPSNLNFAQIGSYIRNCEYILHKRVEHKFEQSKLQLAEIPWKDVPIPEPKMNVKMRVYTD